MLLDRNCSSAIQILTLIASSVNWVTDTLVLSVLSVLVNAHFWTASIYSPVVNCGVWGRNMRDKPYLECSGCGCQKLTTSPTWRLKSGRSSENYNWHKVHIGINTQNVLNNYVVVNFINFLLFPQLLINLVVQNQTYSYDHSQWQAPHRRTRIKILPK